MAHHFSMQALLGTRTSADLNLIAQLLMITGLWIGFYFAHTHQIPRHRNMQTTVVLTNSLLILFVMITSFYNFVILGGTTGGTVATLMIIHGALGLLAELTGIYLILRMRTQLIPPRFRVRNFKVVMRTLLGTWTLIVALGLGIYYFRYLAPKPVVNSPIAQLQRAADDIQIHAAELKDAAGRNNLATAKRHAEHLINLIEGKNGADYGDADHDGVVEDPGDGVGARNYLNQVRDASTSQIADQVQDEMLKVVANAKKVIQAISLTSLGDTIAELTTLAEQVDKGTVKSVPQIAQTLNASTALPTSVAPSMSAQTITVDLKNFEFNPKTLSVKKGDTVVFVNRDEAKHTVTSDDAKFNSGDLPAAKTFSFTFNDAGTFPYHCEYHGDKGGVDMAGTIVVKNE